MRVLVAGATGVIGRQLVPSLRAAGHEVVAVSRSQDRAAQARADGAEFVSADILDRPAIAKVVRTHAPDAIVHLATAIPAELNPKKLAQHQRQAGPRLDPAVPVVAGRIPRRVATGPSLSRPARAAANFW